MMEFIKGFVLGFSIAAPVGPIGILCIRRSLSNGMLSGFSSGLGAAVADAFFGAVAAFGLVAISSFLVDNQFVFRLLGGLYLLYLGYQTFLSAPPEKRIEEGRKSGLFSDFGSTFLLTLTNPMTIISFGAIFTGFGVGLNSGDGYFGAIVMVLGVFLGSGAWWLLLSGGVGILGDRINSKRLSLVNKFSGVVLGGFGILSLMSLL